MSVDLIIVPQGAEYSSVVRGLKKQGLRIAEVVGGDGIVVCPIPIGSYSLTRLQHLVQTKHLKSSLHGQTVLLLGLGGSLSAQYCVGDIVIPRLIDRVISRYLAPADLAFRDSGRLDQSRLEKRYVPDSDLVHALYQSLEAQIAQMPSVLGIVHGVTSDRVITTPQKKQQLSKTYNAELVDMEGAYVLDFFQKRGARVVVVRVISDNHDGAIPDLDRAIDSNGQLKVGMIAWQFFRQPNAAARLIRGSLKGLRVLEDISACCATLAL